LIRYLSTAAATAAISFGIMAATSKAHNQAHSYRAVVGDRVAFPGVDLGCSLARHAPTIRERRTHLLPTALCPPGLAT
jgi:hypothetical protein